MAVKGDLFHLSGDISAPVTYGVVIALSLILRLPFIRKFFASLRTRILFLLTRMIPQPKADTEQ